MKRFALLLCFLGVSLAHAAGSTADAGLTEVMELGRLNGQVLACGYINAVARIKAVMIEFAPKSRRYGAAFEEAANEAFLAQSRKERNTCPDGPTFAEQVEGASRRLQAALPPAAPLP
ncbi:MAG: hypothetical protein WC091_04250 [Sulfuricellaceae bacterium]